MRVQTLRRVAVWVIAAGIVVLIVAFGKLASADQTASLTIRVEAPGPAHGFEFSGGYGAASFTETLGHDGEYTLDGIVSAGIQVGVHQAVESEPWLWRLTGIECASYLNSLFGPIPSGNNVTYGYDLADGYLWVQDPEPGLNTVCTFANAYEAGSFTFQTEVDAANSNQIYTWDPDQEFTYGAYLSGGQTSIRMKDGEYRTDTALPVRSRYTVFQWLIPGWETEVDCTGSADWWTSVEGQKISLNADFKPENTLFCTFTNTYVVSSLTLEVNAPEDPGQEFRLVGSTDAPTEDPTTTTGPFDPVLTHGDDDTRYFVVGDLIVVHVSQDLPDGWEVKDTVCVEFVDGPFGIPGPPQEYDFDPSDYFYPEEGYLQFHLPAGANLKCTFSYNHLAGQINIRKAVVGTDPGGSFEFTMAAETIGPLSDGGIAQRSDLKAPWQYQIHEVDEPGWDLVSVSCTGGSVTELNNAGDFTLSGVAIDLEDGDVYTCTFTNEYVNRPPEADAGGPYVLDEGSILAFDGSGSSDPDGDQLTYEWDLDNDGEYDDATGPAPLLWYSDGPAGYTIGLKVTDSLGETDTDTASVTVYNVAPTVALHRVIPSASDEGKAVTVSATFTDPAGDDDEPYTCTVDYGDGSGLLVGTADGYTCTGPSHVYADNGVYGIKVTVADDDGGSGSASVDHTVWNVPPEVSVSSVAQAVQYSDLIEAITITATDVAADVLKATVTAVPGLSLDPESCSVASGARTCGWTLSGPVRLPAGTHTMSVVVEDDDGGSTVAEVTLTVLHEDALVAFGTDNTIVVPVTDPGSDESEPFSLLAYVHEAPETGDDVAPGDINLVEVNLTLEPVGPGSRVTVACDSTEDDVSPYDYSALLEVSCDVSGIPVNAYVATVSIDGHYYRGDTDEDVVVVYDPSLGFTTGGGWFAWPGTGERTTFGYTMNYNKKATNVKGSLVVIRRTVDGMRYRLKSNAILGLALGETSDMGWASFLGKATYLEPGMAEPEGNHTFMAYVEDRGAGSDRIWIEVLDKDDAPVALSLDRPAEGNAIELEGGKVVVPHKPLRGAE